MKYKRRLTNGQASIVGGIAGGLIVCAGVIGGSYKILQNVVAPKTKDYHKLYHQEVGYGRFNEEEFHSLDKEEFNLESDYGYNLHGFFFSNASNKTIIILHGITCNLWTSVKYMKMFYDRGYNVCIYDHRNHGLSGGEFSSLGVHEKYDAKQIIEYMKHKVGEDSIIGLHGESMGAGTAMMTLGVTDDVDFLIEDCGYSSMYEELRGRLKEEYRLPAFPFLQISNFLVNVKYSFDFFKDSPIKAVEKSKVPTLFIHGGNDNYVPTSMVYDLYNAKIGQKELHVFEKSKHAASFVDYGHEYVEVVHDFLDKYGF